MIWLSSETSTNNGSIAVFDDARLLGDRQWCREGSHSEYLTASCADLFKQLNLNFTQIERLAVGVGPGSFTGIRVAVNFTRTTAYSLGIPVFALDSLQLTALPYLHSHGHVQVSQYAFRDLVYFAEYKIEQSRAQIICPPQVLPKQDWFTRLSSGVLSVGSAHTAFPEVTDLAVKVSARPKASPQARNFALASVSSVEKSQLLSWNQVVPLYIRASEAEEKLRQGLLKPL